MHELDMEAIEFILSSGMSLNDWYLPSEAQSLIQQRAKDLAELERIRKGG